MRERRAGPESKPRGNYPAAKALLEDGKGFSDNAAIIRDDPLGLVETSKAAMSGSDKTAEATATPGIDADTSWRDHGVENDTSVAFAARATAK